MNHEYALFSWAGAEREVIIGKLPHTQKQEGRYKEQDSTGRFEWVNFRKHGGTREESPKMYYPLFINARSMTFRIPSMHWDDSKQEWILEEQPKNGELILYPIDEVGQARRWKWSVERLNSSFKDVKVDFDKNGKPTLYIKSRKPAEGMTPPTWWDKKEYSATDWGTRTLKDLFGIFGGFDYPKAVDLVADCIRVLSPGDKGFILDFFAGSGTTGHAVINLNREDGGRRKFILVEVAQYFDTVLLPRIKKVTFTPEWKDGKPLTPTLSPQGRGGGEAAGVGNWITRSPRIVKVIRLESYEDTLNNLTFDEEGGQKALDLFKDEYLLRYMLKWETRQSETLLDVEKLQSPFSYKLRIHRDGETRERLVDLPETFNYLLGLDVQTRCALPSPFGRGVRGEGRYLVYRGSLRNGRTVAVIWRETTGWTKEDYERDRDFVAEQRLTDGADEIFVNGDSLIPGAQSLDPVFKERMFAGVEV